MQRETIEFTTHDEWLSLRTRDITSTESSALLGVSPYATAYELHHQKRGLLERAFAENERMKWGNRLENAIAHGVAEDLGLIVEPFKVYIRLPEHRLGSSFDFKVVGLADDWRGEENEYRDLFRAHGPGIMECKNVDGLAFRRGWGQDDEGIEAPLHIEVQVQHQMAVSGLRWAVVAPLVAGNTPRPFARLHDAQTEATILAQVAEFWRQVDAETPPDPDYTRDGDAIAALSLDDDGETLDLSGNDRLAQLCHEYKAAADDEKAGKQRKDAAKAEIMDIIGTAARVETDGFRISAKTRKGSPGKTVTPDMVGTTYGARKATRYPTITALK